MKRNYQRTLKACYLGFITQAIAANFAQLLVDVFCARFVCKSLRRYRRLRHYVCYWQRTY